jgi:cytochrome P450
MSTTAIDPTVVAPPRPPRSALPPGPRAPGLLQALLMSRRPLDFAMGVHRRYGEPFTMDSPGFGASVVFSSPELIQPILTGDPRVFHAGLANAPMKPVLGPWSLLILDRAPHMRQRKLLLPPFHGERLRAYADLIAELAQQEVRTWPIGTPFALHERMERLTLEVILEVVFGITDDARQDELRRLLPLLVASGRRLVFWGTIAHRDVGPLHPRATFEARRAAVDALLYAEIADRRALGADQLARRNDILSMLIGATHEDGTPMGDAELRDELLTLVLAGHETTATALTWAMDLLHRNPGVLARVRAGEDEDYLEAVCKEALRIRPVVPIVGRDVTEPVRIGEHEIPAGTDLVVAILITHHREDVFPEPGRFRPERSWATRCPPMAGCRSAAACGAASARASRSSRWRRSCARWRVRRCASRCAGPSRSAPRASRWCPGAECGSYASWAKAGSSDEVADASEDRRVARQRYVFDAAGFGVSRSAQDDAFVRVDDRVAARPPGPVIDGAGRLVARVEFFEECRSRTHLDARRFEAEARGRGAVIGPAERDPLVHVGFMSQRLDVVAAAEAAHRVGDDVHLRRPGVSSDVGDSSLDVSRGRHVGLRGSVREAVELFSSPAFRFEVSDHRVPDRAAGGPAVHEQDRVGRAGDRPRHEQRSGRERDREQLPSHVFSPLS